MQAMSEDNKEEIFTMSGNFIRWSKQQLEKNFYSNESPHLLKAEWFTILQEI
jgi:hypothetical protein